MPKSFLSVIPYPLNYLSTYPLSLKPLAGPQTTIAFFGTFLSDKLCDIFEVGFLCSSDRLMDVV